MNKTIVLLIIGVFMIALGFALNVVFVILEQQNSFDIGYCVMSKIDSNNPINDTNAQSKLAQMLELAQQDPALYEQITQPCSSQYPAYHFHLGWISGLIFSVGIVIVIIAAIKMIRSKRRQQRQERQEKEEGEGGVNI
jgi:uncharacterized membrane protein